MNSEIKARRTLLKAPTVDGIMPQSRKKQSSLLPDVVMAQTQQKRFSLPSLESPASLRDKFKNNNFLSSLMTIEEMDDDHNHGEKSLSNSAKAAQKDMDSSSVDFDNTSGRAMLGKTITLSAQSISSRTNPSPEPAKSSSHADQSCFGDDLTARDYLIPRDEENGSGNIYAEGHDLADEIAITLRMLD